MTWNMVHAPLNETYYRSHIQMTRERIFTLLIFTTNIHYAQCYYGMLAGSMVHGTVAGTRQNTRENGLKLPIHSFFIRNSLEETEGSGGQKFKKLQGCTRTDLRNCQIQKIQKC